MPLNLLVRSVVGGVAAAVVVVSSYAWGHGARPAAAATPAVAIATPDSDATASPTTGGVTVDGTGKVTGTPDLLRLDTSINVTKPDVGDALQAANTTMAAVQQSFKSDGVAAADLQTSGLSVQPNYDYTDNAQHLTGYAVSENLSVVLRSLSNAGTAISDAARAGGNALSIGGASLDLDGDDALLAQARQNAFDDAKAKAQAYATAAGRTLGAVTTISESTDDSQQPQEFAYPEAAAAAPSAAPVPIQAGSQDVTVDVTVTWALQ
jgi:uncharacterized protein YggE